ncbi:hypothetical protein BH09BAC1_BH09BAC1_17570 [soil metagenome]
MSNLPRKRLRRPRQSVVVPFEFIDLDEGGNHVMLHGAINGHPCRMILDTGASRTVADLTFIQSTFPETALESNEQLSAGLGTNTMQSHFFVANEIRLGDKTIPGQLLAVLDLSHVNQTYQMLGIPEVQIILGSDILKAHKAIIDYGGMQLILG